MNCKPGDLAVIVGYSPKTPWLTGRIVEVIELAPVGVSFKLPDGKSHQPCPAGEWVIRFQNPVDLSEIRGRTNALYAACHDSKLRPLRDPGEGATDEIVQKLGAPSREEVAA